MKKHEFSRVPVEVPKVDTENRFINTAIPSPGTDKTLKLLEKFESRSMQGQIPIIWNRAENFNVFDKAGNKWIDFTSTIFVSNVGHGNQHVMSSVRKVFEKPLLIFGVSRFKTMYSSKNSNLF